MIQLRRFGLQQPSGGRKGCYPLRQATRDNPIIRREPRGTLRNASSFSARQALAARQEWSSEIQWLYPSKVSCSVFFSTETADQHREEEISAQPPSKHDIPTIESMTDKFLNESQFPKGSLSLQEIEEARKCVLLWAALKSPQSVKMSFRLVERLADEYEVNFRADVTEQDVGNLLNYEVLNAIIKNWYGCWKDLQSQQFANKRSDKISEKIKSPDDILQWMEEICQRCSHFGPQTKALSTVMRAIAYVDRDGKERGLSISEARNVETILRHMVEEYKAGNLKLTPTIIEYNIVINALAKARDPERAEAMLFRLCDDYEQEVSNLMPDHVSFGSVLYAWKHAALENGGKRSETVLDRMIRLGKKENDKSLAMPGKECYFSVLNAYCAQNEKEGMEQAKEFLGRMQKDFASGNPHARPTSEFYLALITAYAKLGLGHEGEQALRSMYDDIKQNGNDQAEITSSHFNVAINGWVRSGSPETMDKIMSLFRTMEEIKVDPDRATYGTLLMALSRSKKRVAPQLAQHLFHDMKRRYEAGNQDCKPDDLIYNAAMHCWSVEGKASKVESLMYELLEQHDKGVVKISDDRPFITLLMAYARNGRKRTVKSADSFFHQMKERCESGVFDFQFSTSCYHALQRCWATAERPDSGEKSLELLKEMQQRYADGDESMRPMEANYKVVMDAFAMIRNPQQAEDVWYKMLQDFLDEKTAAKPSIHSCKAVLKAWVMSDAPDAIERTLGILDQIAEIDQSNALEIKIDMNSFHLLFDMCSKSKNPKTIAGAEVIFRKMFELCNTGRWSVMPDARCYNMVMKCWSVLGRGERAEALFWELYNKYLQTGDESLAPDVVTVTTVLSSWSRSDDEDAARRAEVFFERVQKLTSAGKLSGIQVDAVCYVALFNCLARAENDEAADAAETLFAELQQAYVESEDKKMRPTMPCYLAFIKCLLKNGRLSRANEILMEMHKLQRQGAKHLKVDKRTCSLVLGAWLRLGTEDSLSRAEHLFRWMKARLELAEHPDALNYATMIRGWAKSRLPESGKRVESLLIEMADTFGGTRPLVQDCQTDLICAYARSDDISRAERLLLCLCDESLAKQSIGEYDAFIPELRAFISVLAMFHRMSVTNPGIRTLQIVERLRKLRPQNRVLDLWESLIEEDPDQRLKLFLEEMDQFDNPPIGGNDKQDVSFMPSVAFKY